MHRLIRSACAIAAEDIGKERADNCAAEAQIRYEALCRENTSDPRALTEDGIDQEKAAWYIREYFQRFAAAYVPPLQRAIRIFGAAEHIPQLFMKISVRSFGEDAGFKYEFPESSGNEARFNIVHCPYYETCRRYGCPEITHVFCDGDAAGYGNLHPQLVWGRTKTIGRGGDCCDFLLQYIK